MKVLLSLTVLCLALPLAHGACFGVQHEAEIKDGKLVKPNGCTDPYDKRVHLFGSTWNTAKCMQCFCGESYMSCCTRYGGVVHVPGCKGVVDPETCEYVLYKEDDPTKLCDHQL